MNQILGHSWYKKLTTLLLTSILMCICVSYVYGITTDDINVARRLNATSSSSENKVRLPEPPENENVLSNKQLTNTIGNTYTPDNFSNERSSSDAEGSPEASNNGLLFSLGLLTATIPFLLGSIVSNLRKILRHLFKIS